MVPSTPSSFPLGSFRLKNLLFTVSCDVDEFFQLLVAWKVLTVISFLKSIFMGLDSRFATCFLLTCKPFHSIVFGICCFCKKVRCLSYCFC